MSKFLVSLRQLDAWFRKQKRILPWRDQPEVYRVWISEIMLQQTQVATVIPYFERFISRFPTVEVLASAELEEVLLHWAGLGYYSRAKNLHRAAQKIVAQGRFPRNREEWLEIPGVGNYTAGAVLSISQDQPEPILDGNVERVLSRLRCVDRHKGDGIFKSRLWRLSDIFVKTAYKNGIRPNILNQALMELGALICTPRNPSCNQCPLTKLCRAQVRGIPESYPPKKKRKEMVQMQEQVFCVFNSQGEILLRKEEEGRWRAGLWDFPRRIEIESEKKSYSSPLGEVITRHVVTHHKIERKAQVLKLESTQKPSALWQAAEPSSNGLRWISVQACLNAEIPMGSAAKRTLKGVLERFPGLAC